MPRGAVGARGAAHDAPAREPQGHGPARGGELIDAVYDEAILRWVPHETLPSLGDDNATASADEAALGESDESGESGDIGGDVARAADQARRTNTTQGVGGVEQLFRVSDYFPYMIMLNASGNGTQGLLDDAGVLLQWDGSKGRDESDPVLWLYHVSAVSVADDGTGALVVTMRNLNTVFALDRLNGLVLRWAVSTTLPSDFELVIGTEDAHDGSGSALGASGASSGGLNTAPSAPTTRALLPASRRDAVRQRHARADGHGAHAPGLRLRRHGRRRQGPRPRPLLLARRRVPPRRPGAAAADRDAHLGVLVADRRGHGRSRLRGRRPHHRRRRRRERGRDVDGRRRVVERRRHHRGGRHRRAGHDDIFIVDGGSAVRIDGGGARALHRRLHRDGQVPVGQLDLRLRGAPEDGQRRRRARVGARTVLPARARRPDEATSGAYRALPIAVVRRATPPDPPSGPEPHRQRAL